jgi:predicted nucleotide-binding protein
VLELGYFIAKLGRKNVAIVYMPEIELPSDINGLLYIKYDGASGVWQTKLAKEMIAAGIEIDPSRV